MRLEFAADGVNLFRTQQLGDDHIAIRTEVVDCGHASTVAHILASLPSCEET